MIFVINKMVMSGLVGDVVEWIGGKARLGQVLVRGFFGVYKRETIVRHIFYKILAEGN